MTATITTLSAALKVRYPQKKVQDTYFKACPTFGLLKKDTNWTGNPMHIALALGGTPGSHTFSTAQTISGSVTNRGFDVTIVRDYNVVRITTEAMRISKNDMGALIRGVDQQVKGALYTQTKTIGIDLHRDGSGARGQIASGADTTVLTLEDPLDAFNFELGDVIVAGLSADGSDASTNTGTITGIDYDAGTLTAAAQWHADFDDADYLFRSGDATLSMAGLESWNPSSAPSATTFFGLDRTASSKLWGQIYNYTVAADGTMERYLINMAARTSYRGAGGDLAVIMHPIRWGNFANEMGDKAIYDRAAMHTDGSTSKVGYKAIKVIGPNGEFSVIADPYIPYNRVRMLDLDHWCFSTLGELGWIDDDGKGQWLRQYNADGMEARLGWFGNLYSDYPGASVTGSVAALNA
jgi:hypothetical protein